MELYGRSSGRNEPQPDPQAEWAPVGPETGLEESMRRLRLWGREVYPERSGAPDCAYYMRTGFCGYGAKCRYNHPHDRGSVGEAVHLAQGDYPERQGEPACQYYLRTGTCKFGASCKFHHPRNANGPLSKVALNSYGYPLRPDEKECSYYLKTGQCKFGITCKFHHPQPAGISVPASARQFYPTVQSLSAPSPEHFIGASNSFGVPRPPLLPGSYVPGAYGPVLLHAGVISLPSWSPYSGAVSPAISPDAHSTAAAASMYGISQLSTSATAYTESHTALRSNTGLSSSSQKEKQFPVRPGQPECQYYMRTGECKFGSSCRYHHPSGWVAAKSNYSLSPLGLPLRVGVQPCSFYLHKGYCKFGHTCKFDHPMGSVRYSPSASSLSDMPISPYILGSSLTTSASISLPEFRPEFVSGSKMESHLATGNISAQWV